MTTDSIQAAAPVRRVRPPKRKTRITIYLDDEVLNEFRTLSERCGTGSPPPPHAALRNRLNGPIIESGVA